jgi:1-deoxy-D-xylulose-5-phosphate reductoisomerase
VDVVIHRQSVIHSLVEYRDGAMLAQLGTPNMKLPIRYAMTYPARAESCDEPLDLLTCGALTFVAPDLENFPCLRLARDCAKRGGNSCAAMNGANEEAVAMFLRDEIGFYDIYDLVSAAVDAVPFIQNPTLDEILETDRLARLAVKNTSIKRGTV